MAVIELMRELTWCYSVGKGFSWIVGRFDTFAVFLTKMNRLPQERYYIMNSIRMVATVSCVLLVGMVLCERANAQTRLTLSQYRAAQARAAQQRAAQIRAAQQRSLQSRTIVRPTTTQFVPSQLSTPTRSSSSVSSQRAEAPKVFEDKVPDAALLTNRGTELAARLKSLRYAESTLGAKHPSMESVREQIVSIKQELKAWTPVSIETESDQEADEEDDAEEKTRETLATMNNSDLRQLVIRLSVDVTDLRQRIGELEANQERISSAGKEDDDDADLK